MQFPRKLCGELQEMIKFLVQFNPKRDIKNRQQLTPFTLAAKLGRKEVIKL